MMTLVKALTSEDADFALAMATSIPEHTMFPRAFAACDLSGFVLLALFIDQAVVFGPTHDETHAVDKRHTHIIESVVAQLKNVLQVVGRLFYPKLHAGHIGQTNGPRPCVSANDRTDFGKNFLGHVDQVGRMLKHLFGIIVRIGVQGRQPNR